MPSCEKASFSESHGSWPQEHPPQVTGAPDGSAPPEGPLMPNGEAHVTFASSLSLSATGPLHPLGRGVPRARFIRQSGSAQSTMASPSSSTPLVQVSPPPPPLPDAELVREPPPVLSCS